MKIVLIGCVNFSHHCFQTLLHLSPLVKLKGIITKQNSSFNSDFYDLSTDAQQANIPFVYAQDINSDEIFHFIKQCEPDFICCFGWSALIKDRLLSSYPIIGYHPTNLPYNRGRHPVIWALALGLKETASTFFMMDRGADSGDILSQKKITITQYDTAKSLCTKLEKQAIQQIKHFMQQIAELQPLSYIERFNILAKPQDHTQANLWRKRTHKDGIIDFRMSSLAIYNLVRALSYPYIGADFIYQGTNIKVWECQIVKVNLPNIEPGKVLKSSKDSILIKTYDQAILFTKFDYEVLPQQGEYV